MLERAELRDRFLKLVSLGDLKTSTKVMDESAGRVSRYLLVQLGVNCGFGFLFGAGMFLLGVPNAILWGLLAVIFRYIPFIGTLAAVLFPATLAFAVDPGWTMLIGVVGTYLVLELLTTNAIEPNLYGTSTGLSPMAVLIAAIFWATLWGLVGLVLATPLTVCLVVLGRYVPQLGFLDILLGSEPVLLPEERFYQRLLAGNAAEAIELTESEMKDGTITEFFDRVGVPALRLAEADLLRDASDLSRRRNVVDVISSVIEELEPEPTATDGVNVDPVLVIGGKTKLDGAAASLLAHSLAASGIEARQAPPMSLHKDGLAQLDLKTEQIVALCYLDPHPQPYVRYAAARLLRKRPDVKVLACLFAQTADSDPADPSQYRVSAVVRSISQAVTQTAAFVRGEAAIDSSQSDAAETISPIGLDTIRRFASQTDWLAAASHQIAEEFGVPQAVAQLAPLNAAAASLRRGLAERVLAAGGPVLGADAALDKEAVDDPFLVENNFRSFVGVPLKLTTGEPIGTVILYGSDARDFTTDLERLTDRADHLVTEMERRTKIKDDSSAGLPRT